MIEGRDRRGSFLWLGESGDTVVSEVGGLCALEERDLGELVVP